MSAVLLAAVLDAQSADADRVGDSEQIALWRDCLAAATRIAPH